MEIRKINNQSKEGFALLITIIVVGVVLSVGMTILDLSIKQVRLSTNSKDSEVSFHAANAGAECARYWRREPSASMVLGESITPTRFGVVPEGGNATIAHNLHYEDLGRGEAFRYEYKFEWAGGSRCTEINTLVASSTLGGGGLTIPNMKTLVPGFPDATSDCEEGSQCTIIAVQGYNKPCGNTGGYGTVQRQVLLQF